MFNSVALTSIATTLALVLAAALLVLAAGGSAGQALGWGMLVALATRLVPILASFPVAYWPLAGHRVPPLGTPALTRTVAREVWATFKLFFYYHPFERLVTRREPERVVPGETPVLLVHGFYANAGFWHCMKPGLRAAGWHNLFAVTLEPPFAGIDALAERLAGHIEAACRACGSDSVVIVAHSMGGLVARVCLARMPRRIRHLICLGTPHRGTVLAYLVPAENTRQMRPGSPWLQRLNANAAATAACTNIYSEHDNIIVPQTSAAPAGAAKIGVGGIGHLDMAFSPVIVDKIKHVLRGVGPGPSA